MMITFMVFWAGVALWVSSLKTAYAQSASPPNISSSSPTTRQALNSAKPAVGVAAVPWKTTSDKPFSEKPFVMSLAQDKTGAIWIGTEGEGVWKYDSSLPADQTWHKYTTTDGLGDDNGYALACDRLGRIWAGHLNHGVSVFNGQKWQNYEVVGGLSKPDTLSGPLGERIFSISVCPTDGDVWMATNAGLARYSEKNDDWRYYTRLEGLPSDQANAIAFDKEGNIYVGTDSDGIAMADASDKYLKWRIEHGPEIMPCNLYGTGLPSRLINDILVVRDGTVYAATTAGLAWSLNKGKTWQYVRGKDWADKVRGLHGGPPAGWTEEHGAPNTSMASIPWSDQQPITKAWLAEDYLTCLEEDESGELWIGYRQNGCALVDAKAGRVHKDGADKQYVTRFVTTTTDTMLVGTYGDGLTKITIPLTNKLAKLPTLKKEGFVTLPNSAKLPTTDDIRAIESRFNKYPSEEHKQETPSVVVLPDDWRTQGEWLGRYGRYWACCCAICSPQDYVWGAGWNQIKYFARIGPNQDPHDSIRYWIHWQYTANNSSLEMPPTYLHSRVVKGMTSWQENRRQAEWDDHGEAYPQTRDGPHLFCNLNVPDGIFYLSLYDFNKDGHAGKERCRDFQVIVRSYGGGENLSIANGYDKWKVLAHSRIHNFYGGVWKRFLVRGPCVLSIEIDRNASFNTNLSGVMLDLVDEEPPPYFKTVDQWKVEQKGIQKLNGDSEISADTQPSLINIGRILKASRSLLYQNQNAWASGYHYNSVQMLRYLMSPTMEQNLIESDRIRYRGSCLYNLSLFDKWEWTQSIRGLTTARQIEKAIRWDGEQGSCQGLGYMFISNYVQTIKD